MFLGTICLQMNLIMVNVNVRHVWSQNWLPGLYSCLLLSLSLTLSLSICVHMHMYVIMYRQLTLNNTEVRGMDTPPPAQSKMHVQLLISQKRNC